MSLGSISDGEEGKGNRTGFSGLVAAPVQEEARRRVAHGSKEKG